ncbi:MAG TPA: PAS domain S-box protein [Candidatus Bathyarchaeia archaeon]
MKATVEPANAVYTDFASEAKIRVLHVDNDAEFLEVAQRCLEEQGPFQVDTALSANEAREKLRNADYDAVIADYQMPEKNGLELLKELRQEGIAVPFILLTCKGREEIAIEALNSGVEQYIEKQGNAEATYEELKHSILSAVERRRTEKRLRESENLLRQITDNIKDTLIVADENLIIMYASSSAKEILGYEPSETVGKSICQFIHPDDLATTMETIKGEFEDRSGGKLEVRCKRADGSYVLVEGIGKILTDENGQVTGVLSTFRDITERKQIEETLQKNEELFKQVSDNAQTWIWEVDSKGLYTYASPTVEKVLGYKLEEIVGKKHFYDLFIPEEREELKEAAFQAFAKKSPFRNFLNRNVHKNGNTVWLSTSGIPIVDEKGNLLGYRGADTDTTENKKMEQTLKESEEKYRKMFEEAIDAIFIADAETGILVDCNRSATELVGRKKSEIIGMRQSLLHPKQVTEGEISRNFEQHRTEKEGIVVEDQIITKNGEIRDVTIKGNLFEVNGKKMLRGVFRDITESKKISEKAYFQARLLNAVGQAIIATDMNGNIIYWNDAAEQLYGWPEAEVLGRNVVEVTPAEASKEQAAKILGKLMAGESWSGEFVAKRRDGTSFLAIVTDTPITNDKGEIIGIIGISTDISEQKWMQEIFNDAIGKVVELNEKLQVVGSLTRHDIRNKLAAVNGRIYLLKKRLDGNTEALLQVQEMEVAAQQMLRILEFERIYEQVGVEELEYIDVEGHLNEAVSLFSDLRDAELINECHGLTVLADSLLRQVFYNLIDNTLKYGEKVSKVRVHYKEEENQLKLMYEDNGVGIPEEIKSNLFKEGFGKGTGYGLYLMKRICEAYGWTIQETGKHGQGAQFTMTIPRSSKDGKKSYEIS